ncbi:hypothetical protein DFH09DRAFT_1316067 [Mycena vulgaris]|nr:hypothetical protein DFH09DRAFT_1316067 [Mycena vulgaris]
MLGKSQEGSRPPRTSTTSYLEVNFPTRIRRGYLFARFVWNIFNFSTPGLVDAAAVVNSPKARPDAASLKRKPSNDAGGVGKKPNQDDGTAGGGGGGAGGAAAARKTTTAGAGT